jgi:hypothetical protein
LFHLKSAHPMSSARIIKNDGDGEVFAAALTWRRKE